MQRFPLFHLLILREVGLPQNLLNQLLFRCHFLRHFLNLQIRRRRRHWNHYLKPLIRR